MFVKKFMQPKEKVMLETVNHFKLRWNTWSVCSMIKILNDIGDNNVKNVLGEAFVKKEVKEMVEEWKIDENIVADN